MTAALATIDGKFSSNYRTVASGPSRKRTTATDERKFFIVTLSRRAWPTIVLVDRKGIIRYSHIGEGAYNKTESVIKQLLADMH